MCRNRNSIDKIIHTKCLLAMTDETEMAKLGVKLLTVFHAVLRSDLKRADDTVNELCYFDDECYDQSEEMKLLDISLTRLEIFMDEKAKDNYDREISNIFELSRMIHIMDALKIKVYNGSKYGPELVSILSTVYMNSFDYSCEEASELLSMSISTFYRKKRRAEILFALAFLEYKANIVTYDPQNYQEGSQLAMVI